MSRVLTSSVNITKISKSMRENVKLKKPSCYNIPSTKKEKSVQKLTKMVNILSRLRERSKACIHTETVKGKGVQISYYKVFK